MKHFLDINKTNVNDLNQELESKSNEIIDLKSKLVNQ